MVLAAVLAEVTVAALVVATLAGSAEATDSMAEVMDSTAEGVDFMVAVTDFTADMAIGAANMAIRVAMAIGATMGIAGVITTDGMDGTAAGGGPRTTVVGVYPGYYPYYGSDYGYPYGGYYGSYYRGPDYGNGYSTDSRVTELQRRLARAGYYSGAIDGIMGPATRGAIHAYERDRGYRGR